MFKRLLANRKMFIGILIAIPFFVFVGLAIFHGTKYSANTSCRLPLYKQTASKWADQKYGYKDKAGTQQATIGSSGCGPTALAMVMAYWKKDSAFTPAVAATYCKKNGFRYNGQGTDPECLIKYATVKGLKAEKVEEKRAIEVLKQSHPIIMLVNSCSNGKYTSAGHYIVLTSITNDFQWKGKYIEKTVVTINDPNKDNTWDYPDNIFGSCKKGGYWYIHRF